jgi:hypothetical protein
MALCWMMAASPTFLSSATTLPIESISCQATRRGDQITVLQGLVAGNRVVIEGGTALEDGMKVRERGKR